MFKYTVSETNEDYKKSKIEKEGLKVYFTIEEIEKHEEALEKMKKEITAKILVDNAKLTNIEENHPWILEMDREKQHHVFLYFKIKSELEPYSSKLKEVEDALEEYHVEKDAIYEQLGFVKSDVAAVDEPAVEAPIEQAVEPVPETENGENK